MQARSALFDLYGDHLRTHGGRAPVAALVRLLAPLEIGAPAVRTAVSRMVRQGWLHPLRLASGPGYLITPKAAKRLDEAAARIYRTAPVAWDGTFDVIIAEPMLRSERLRVANNLAYLGYGSIGDCTWVATKPSAEAEAVLDESGVEFERFTATHAGGEPGASALMTRAWDLDAIGREYQQFVKTMTPGRGRRRRARRPGDRVHRPVPAGARLAHIPVPGPGTAAGPAARSTGPAMRPPSSSTPTPAGCARPRINSSRIA